MFKARDLERDLIIINGIEFSASEIMEYGNTNTKTYSQSPERGITGNIPDIDDISTFETPRLRIGFGRMTLATWRKLKMATKPNSFDVEYYDWEYDMRVVHNMYYATQDDIDIFERFIYYQEYTISANKTVDIVGTNNAVGKLNITYYSTDSNNVTTTHTDRVDRNATFLISDGSGFTNNGKVLKGWAVASDKNTVKYALGMAMRTTQSLSLYAVWQDTANRTIYYDYSGVSRQQKDGDSSQWIKEQSATYNATIGTMPSPRMYATNSETGELVSVGTFNGWWTIPFPWQTDGANYVEYMARMNAISEAGSVREITSNTAYKWDTNITLYAHWQPKIFNVTFNTNGGTDIPKQAVAYKNKITQPTAPTKQDKIFDGWYLDSTLSTRFTNWYMDYSEDITLYAKWN